MTGQGKDIIEGGIENVQADSTGGAVLVGNESDNILSGSLGDDRINGRGEDDCLSPILGTDEVHGGPGLDSFTASIESLCNPLVPDNNLWDPFQGVTVDLPNGKATGNNSTSFLWSIEDAYGTTDRDRFTGDDKDNRFFGLGAADTIQGAGGDDYIDGGLGPDVVDGGFGTDECINSEAAVACES